MAINFIGALNAVQKIYAEKTNLMVPVGCDGKTEHITYTLEDAIVTCVDESSCYDGKTISFNRPEGWEDIFVVGYKIIEKYYYDEDASEVKERTFDDMDEMEWTYTDQEPMYDLLPYVQDLEEIPDETPNEWLVIAQIVNDDFESEDDYITVTDKWTINVDNDTEYPYCSECQEPTEFTITNVTVTNQGGGYCTVEATVVNPNEEYVEIEMSFKDESGENTFFTANLYIDAEDPTKYTGADNDDVNSEYQPEYKSNAANYSGIVYNGNASQLLEVSGTYDYEQLNL